MIAVGLRENPSKIGSHREQDGYAEDDVHYAERPARRALGMRSAPA